MWSFEALMEKEGFLEDDVGTSGWEGRRERMCGTRTLPKGICEGGSVLRLAREREDARRRRK